MIILRVMKLEREKASLYRLKKCEMRAAKISWVIKLLKKRNTPITVLLHMLMACQFTRLKKSWSHLISLKIWLMRMVVFESWVKMRIWTFLVCSSVQRARNLQMWMTQADYSLIFSVQRCRDYSSKGRTKISLNLLVFQISRISLSKKSQSSSHSKLSWVSNRTPPVPSSSSSMISRHYPLMRISSPMNAFHFWLIARWTWTRKFLATIK